MSRALRPLTFVAVAVLAFTCSACKSNNEGKIVGKWASAEAVEGLPPGSVTLEFTQDGKFSMNGLGMTVLSGDYRLGSGDYLTISNITGPGAKDSKKGRIKVTITGDNLTWTEDKGAYRFNRDKGTAATK